MRFVLPGLLCACVLFASFSAPGATLVVANTNDSGPGSFRQALLNANATNGLDTVVFQIPGTGVHALAPQSPYPALTERIVIDGTSQAGYAGRPLIELDGTAVRDSAGLHLLGGSSTIRGLAINRFGGSGIQVEGAGTNTIQANFIGTDPTGIVGRGNGLEGIWLLNSAGNQIGGAAPGEGNLVSGNGDAGIYILNSGANVIAGNVLGTTALGTGPLGNANNGITLYNSASNQVGGATAGWRNLISANQASGIYLYGAGSIGNRVQGNWIGTEAAGNLAMGNAGDGITLQGASCNTLGGGGAGEGNLVSANGKGGISLSEACSNAVSGNLIGTVSSGQTALGNAYAGVTLNGCTNNTVGGVTPGNANLISGNQKDGVFITSQSQGNIVSGNVIGLDAVGVRALPNGFNGVTISASKNNTIGGPGPGFRNVISGNSMYGIQLNPGADGNVISANFIGPDVTGEHAEANGLSGVRVESGGNLIGGASPALRNIISGNSDFGVLLIGPGAESNTVCVNYIGTTAGGSSPLGNESAGVGILGAAHNTIGGASGTSGNLVSANRDAGIYIAQPEARENLLLGNIIGADASGLSPLGNAYEGVYIEGAPGTAVGAQPPGLGNLISANHTRGIFLTNALGTVVQGNLLGTALDGKSPLPNAFHNLELEANTTNTVIGGPESAANILAFAPSPYAGARIRTGSRNNLLAANCIFGNGALGIDLGPVGVTPNDPCDSDTGANLLQNFPVLTQAVSGAGTSVRGTLASAPLTMFRLRFFASPPPAASQSPQGQVYLGETSVGTDGGCTAAFVATLPDSVPPGWVLTATATDPANNTSEFSAGVAAAPLPLLHSTVSNGVVLLGWSNTVPVALRQTASLCPPVAWSVVTNAVVSSGGLQAVSIPSGTGNRFYTLVFE